MTATVLKSYFHETELKIISYRNFKIFSTDKFRFSSHPQSDHRNNLNVTLASFLEHCTKVLDIAARKIQKYIRDNNGPFMNKDRKDIMKKTRLRNKYLKNQCAATTKAYNYKRYLCVSIVKKAKWDYYNKRDHKKLTHNKNFWKTGKPFFTDKGINNEKMLLIEEGEITSDNKKILENLTNFFCGYCKKI